MMMSVIFFVTFFFFGFTLISKMMGYFTFLSQIIGGKSHIWGSDVKRDLNYTPLVTFMVPCFNESKVLCDSVESIMESDYPKDKIEIYLVDDCSKDDTWEWIKRMMEKYPNNVVGYQNPQNQGKSPTLCDITERCKGEIVFTVDSDTSIAPNVIREIVSCYGGDSNLGAVAGQVRTKNLNASVWTAMQGMKYVNYFYLFKMFENRMKTNRCMLGPLASFRREVYLQQVNAIRTRSFLGCGPIKAGEDSFSTSLAALGSRGVIRPWKIFINLDAIAWTNCPETFLTYHNQQLRWMRSSILGGWETVWDIHKHTFKAGGVPTFVSLIPLFGFLSLIPMLWFFWFSGLFLTLFGSILITSFFDRLLFIYVYNWTLAKSDPIGKVERPIRVAAVMSMWTWVLFILLAIISPWTMDDGGWVTREGGHNNFR